jgi:hypothetical protein
MKNYIIGIAFLIVLLIAVTVINKTHTQEITEVKIIKLEQQSLMKGNKESIETEIRYLVITDKGTFVCESNILRGKFNNSDIFYRLVEGKTYPRILVTGFGKNFLFNYKNIEEVEGL